MAECLGCWTSESVGPGFESQSEHSPEFSNPSAALANSQLVCHAPDGILNHVMFHLQYLFQLFEWHAPVNLLVCLRPRLRQHRGRLSVLPTIIINSFLHRTVSIGVSKVTRSFFGFALLCTVFDRKLPLIPQSTN